MKPVLIIVASLVAITGCNPQLDDLVAYTDQVKQNTRVSIEAYPEFDAQPAFAYSAQDLRSPFQRPKDKVTQVEVARDSNCQQPDFNRRKEALEKFGLDELALSGSFSVGGTKWVLFKTKNGGLYKAHKGSRIGLSHGKITAVSDNAVTIEQLLPDGAGCWQRKEITLTSSPAAGENENV